MSKSIRRKMTFVVKTGQKRKRIPLYPIPPKIRPMSAPSAEAYSSLSSSQSLAVPPNQPEIANDRAESSPNIEDNLVKFWRVGMRTADSPFVQEASSTLGLSQKKIKIWIDNYRESLKPKGSNRTKPKPTRLINGYNLFCSGLNPVDFTKFGMLWSKLTKEERDFWNKKAKLVSAKERMSQSQIKQRKNKLVKSLKSISADFQEIGIPFGGLIFFEGSVEIFGDSSSKDFFLKSPDILPGFLRSHSQDADAVLAHNKDVLSLRREVRRLFNLKYSEAVGTPSKMPYSKRELFKVLGLPGEFRNPSNYGPKLCQQIIDSQHDIIVVLNTQQEDAAVSEVASFQTNPVDKLEIRQAEDFAT